MKKFTFKGVLDGFRSSVGGVGATVVTKLDQELADTLKQDAFQAGKTIRLGFPHQPTAMAYDPIQKLLAIGTKNGGLRILGRPGVNVHVRHEFAAEPPGPGPGGTGPNPSSEQGNGQGHSASTSGPAVIFIQFVTNEGLVVTATADDTLHLWSLKQKRPEIIHSIKFTRERISCLLLPFTSKWLYVGTEKGNVHVVNVDTFVLSGYVINWNKAIELTRSSHPGPVVHLSDCPMDSSKLLIGFETGLLSLWDLKTKTVESRYNGSEGLRSASWLSDGKQFVSSYADGSLMTWSTRVGPKPLPTAAVFPHAKMRTDGKLESCKPILKVDWRSSSTGEPYMIFSGGLPQDRPGRSPCITVINGRSTTVLEMEHNVVDFISLTDAPWPSEFQDPHSIIVLLQNDLVIVDLLTPGFPCLENPYPMDLHATRVTCIEYHVNAPSDLIPALYSVGGVSHKRPGFSERGWPVSGGREGSLVPPYSEILITGHEDGTVKFWDTSAVTLQVLYKMKVSKVFEKLKSKSSVESLSCRDLEPFAVTQVALCRESRVMVVALASNNVVLYKFRKVETTGDIHVIEVPIVCDSWEADQPQSTPEFEFVKKHNGRGQGDECNSSRQTCLLRVRSGQMRKPPGFQPELVTSPIPGVDGEPTRPLTSLSVNSAYGLLAYGHEGGLVVIDYIQKTVLLNMTTSELYSSADPYNRLPRSPKRPTDPTSEDRCKSPTSEHPISSKPSVNDITLEGVMNRDDIENMEHSSDFEQIELPEKQEQEERKKPSSKSFDLKRKLTKMDLKLKELWSSSASTETRESLSRPATPTDVSPSVFKVSTSQSNHQLDSHLKSLDTGEKPKPFRRTKTDPLRQQDLPAIETGGKPVAPPRKTGKSYARPSVVDLRDVEEEAGGVFSGLAKRFNKLDNTFSRSRSSSMSSLDVPGLEAITSVTFADTFARKQDIIPHPTLWAGTSQGSVLAVVINFPAPGDPRLTQPLMVSPSGTIFRLKGSVQSVAFLDATGSLVPPPWESWRDEGKTRTPTRNSVISQSSPSNSQDSNGADSSYCVLVSQKQARVLALPSHTCVGRANLCTNEQCFIIRSDVVPFKDGCVIAAFASSGRILVHSLPTLRPMLDVEFLPLVDLRFQTTSRNSIMDPIVSIWAQQMIVNEDTEQIARTFRFGEQGHGVFLCSPSEIEKFTLSADFIAHLPEMVCELYSQRDMPEPPKEGFLKGLFGGGVRNLDREELFGEASGKAFRGVAKHVGPSANMDALNSRATGIAAEVAKTRQQLVERGEKLGLLEERTQRMMNEAEAFGNAAGQLMVKYRDRKWYQL